MDILDCKLSVQEYKMLENILITSANAIRGTQLYRCIKKGSTVSKTEVVSFLEDFIKRTEYDLSNEIDFTDLEKLTEMVALGIPLVRANNCKCVNERLLCEKIRSITKKRELASSEWWHFESYGEGTVMLRIIK